MKNQAKIFQKLFRHVPLVPLHAIVSDSNLQILNFETEENLLREDLIFCKRLLPSYAKKSKALAIPFLEHSSK